MKKILFIGFALFTILILCSLSTSNDNNVEVESKDTNLPEWQWTSGAIQIKKTAAKQFFTITFSPKIYHPRDSIKITFISYKVALSNIGKGANLSQWSGKMSLVHFINNNWIPVVADTNDRINRPFSGKKNNRVDSLTKYNIWTTVPLSRTLTITGSSLSCLLNNTISPSLLADPAMGPLLTVSIKGIEVKKLGQIQ